MGRSRTDWFRILGVSVLLAAAPAFAGGVAIVTTSLTDNGDNDGFADSNETLTLFLTVRNTSGVPLSNVTARLYTLQPEVACLSTPEISIGSLAVDEELTTSQGFVFTVSDVDRSTLGLGPYDDLSVTFQVSIDSDPPQKAYSD